MGWSNSIRYGGRGDEPVVRLSPADAATQGVPNGSTVVVTSAHGEVEATVVVDDSIRPGVVSMTHGHTGRSPGRLTSNDIDVDPLTAMPHASGLAVSISPTAAQPPTNHRCRSTACNQNPELSVPCRRWSPPKPSTALKKAQVSLARPAPARRE